MIFFWFGLSPRGYSQQSSGKITPFSVLKVDRIEVFRYSWRCRSSESCHTYSQYGPRQSRTRMWFTNPQGHEVRIASKDYLDSSMTWVQRPYATLPLRPMPPVMPKWALLRMGYRNLAPYSALADVQIGNKWLENVLVYRPITTRLIGMTAEGKLLKVPFDSVQYWRRALPDSARYSSPLEEEQALWRWPSIDVYFELAGGVAANFSDTKRLDAPNIYGWKSDYALASVYAAAGVSLWERLSVGLRLGFDIPYGQGSYTPPDPQWLPGTSAELPRQEFTAHTLVQARYLKSEARFFYTGSVLLGAAYSRLGAGPWFEFSNGMSVLLKYPTYLLVEAYFFTGTNGVANTVNYGPGIRAGLTTLIPVWRGARMKK